MTGELRSSNFRSGYVAILGRPNVGKSTLLNRLVGRHVSIIAPRPQTTRHRILGILNGERLRGACHPMAQRYQALFLDTPGILKPAYRLQELMEKEVQRALADADVVLPVIDAVRPELPEPGFASGKRVVAAINKVDKVEKEKLLPLAAELGRQGIADVFMVSALKGSGVEDLKQAVAAALPEGEPFYPPDIVSERPERFFAAEIVREAVFNRYGEEIPYSSTVVVEEFKERPGRKDYIRAVIYVERDSQRAIIIGRGGQALKKVGSIARRHIEHFLGRPVYLELWVKVAEAWRKDDRFIRENIYPA